MTAIAGGLLATPLAAQAQQTGRTARVGILSPYSPSTDWVQAVIEELQRLGWVEGKNLILHRRYAERRNDRLPALAVELVQLHDDVIVTTTTPAVLALKQATSTIPIVAAGIADPVATGLVGTLSRPGGNLTGLSSLASELNAKRLQLLLEIAPAVTRVAVLTNPSSAASREAVKEIRNAASQRRITLHVVEVERVEDIPSALARVLLPPQAEALLVPNEPLLFPSRKEIADFALEHRLPSMFAYREHADVGGLMSYAPNYPDILRRAAVYVDKILKGAKPGDLPIEQPTKFELAINLKTAKALGLTIPPSLLARADEVIE